MLFDNGRTRKRDLFNLKEIQYCIFYLKRINRVESKTNKKTVLE